MVRKCRLFKQTEVEIIETEEAAEETEAEPQEAEQVKGGVAPVTRTHLLLKPVTYIGNLESQPGHVLTGTTAPGGTTRAPAPRTTGTSLPEQKSSIEKMTHLTLKIQMYLTLFMVQDK